MFYYFGVTLGALYRVMGAEDSEHPGMGVNVIAGAGAVRRSAGRRAATISGAVTRN